MLSDGLIQNQSLQTARTVFAPKVTGTRNILGLVGREPVSAVKLFSSVAASLGSGGQANYAAANAVMDCWAAQGQDQVSASLPPQKLCLKSESLRLLVRNMC